VLFSKHSQTATKGKGRQMNKLEAKAAELIELAKKQGVNAVITYQTEHYIFIDYNKTISSVLSYTYTGKVSVKSWEDFGPATKRRAISQKNLPFYLEGYEETRKRVEQILERVGA
jgi:hypothetical protein